MGTIALRPTSLSPAPLRRVKDLNMHKKLRMAASFSLQYAQLSKSSLCLHSQTPTAEIKKKSPGWERSTLAPGQFVLKRATRMYRQYLYIWA